MAITIKQIASGAINNSVSSFTDLTTAVADGKAQIIKNMRFYNTSSSASITLTLAFYLGTGADKIIAKVNMDPETVYIENDEITMEKDHKIRYKTGTTGGPIDFVVSGIQRDV